MPIWWLRLPSVFPTLPEKRDESSGSEPNFWSDCLPQWRAYLRVEMLTVKGLGFLLSPLYLRTEMMRVQDLSQTSECPRQWRTYLSEEGDKKQDFIKASDCVNSWWLKPSIWHIMSDSQYSASCIQCSMLWDQVHTGSFIWCACFIDNFTLYKATHCGPLLVIVYKTNNSLHWQQTKQDKTCENINNINETTHPYIDW